MSNPQQQTSPSPMQYLKDNPLLAIAILAVIAYGVYVFTQEGGLSKVAKRGRPKLVPTAA